MGFSSEHLKGTILCIVESSSAGSKCVDTAGSAAITGYLKQYFANLFLRCPVTDGSLCVALQLVWSIYCRKDCYIDEQRIEGRDVGLPVELQHQRDLAGVIPVELLGEADLDGDAVESALQGRAG